MDIYKCRQYRAVALDATNHVTTGSGVQLAVSYYMVFGVVIGCFTRPGQTMDMPFMKFTRSSL